MSKITEIMSASKSAGWNLDDNMVKTLVSAKVGADAAANGVGDDYFRVLVVRSVNAPGANDQEKVTVAHSGLYALVTEVAITDALKNAEGDDDNTKKAKAQERNRRTNFARSAVSTLRRYLKAGGTLSEIDVATASKTSINNAAVSKEQAASGTDENSPESQIIKRLAALVTAIQKFEGTDKAAHQQACIDAIKAA